MIGAIRDYFSAIGRTVVTLGDGLAVTGSYLLRRPMTLQYPDRMALPLVAMLPERSRGLLEVDLARCTGCALCQKTCPIDCIRIEISKGRDRMIRRFDLELGRCMHCGLCVESCPAEAIRHTREFEGGMYDPALLLVHFVEKPRPVAKRNAVVETKPVGAILRRLLPDAWGRHTRRQIEASKAELEAIDSVWAAQSTPEILDARASGDKP